VPLITLPRAAHGSPTHFTIYTREMRFGAGGRRCARVQGSGFRVQGSGQSGERL